MQRYLQGPRAGRRLVSATAGLLALAATTGLASLTGCGSQIAGAAARQTASITRGSTASGGHGTASLASVSRVSSPPGISGTPSGVTGGALFGGSYPLVSQEKPLGRKLAIVRIYDFIGDSFPGPAKYQTLLKGGRTVVVSMDSKVSYASIAAGHEDGPITSFLKEVNQAAIQYNLASIYVTFEHEPDSVHHRALGAPVQFIQAWDHVHQLAVAAHLDWNQGGRLHWVLILIHTAYQNGGASAYWPGSGEADIVAADGYNSYRCGNQAQHQIQTPAMLFNPLLAFAAAHGGLPVFIAEFGSDTSTPNAQPRFIEQMQAYLASNRQIAAALYWDDAGTSCNYRVDGHPSALSALAALGRSAVMQGRALPAS
jgi:hypothetical protein